MLVVSDTSPITALMQVDRIDLLHQIFGQVLIPPAVRNELLRYHAKLPDYLESRSILRREVADALEDSLDRGEAEAIALAEETHAQFLLMDERRGRSIAASRGLKVVGLLGVLLLGKKAGHLGAILPILNDLERRAGFYVSDAVKRVVLSAAEEID